MSRPIAASLLGLLVALPTACECGEDVPPPKSPTLPPIVQQANDGLKGSASDDAEPSDPANVTLHQATELGDVDMAQVERLDLAMSSVDQVGHMEQGGTETACNGLDLVRVATAAPKLSVLRISGCPDAVRAGLGAFADTVEELELADLVLDEVMVGRLAQLRSLRRLTLRRVERAVESLQPLGKLDLREVTLAELDKASELSQMLDLWPNGLQRVALVGNWAGHNAMITLSRAAALRALELRDTRVGNYSLNQIKGLERLEEVVYVGPTFTDNSPLYFRHLPVKKFVCECPRMGDGGLKAVKQNKTLEELELRQTRVTGPGLATLEGLSSLRSLVLTGIDVDAEGFAALAVLPRLRQLDLAGELFDPTLEGLGGVASLETLILRYPDLDDRAAPQLAKLAKLRELDLSRTRISDVGLASLAGLTALEVLKLHHTQVTNRGLEHLAGLTSLRVLELDHTDVVDAGVAHLRQLTALEELRLDATLITDASVEHLTALPKLRRLNLADTVLTQAGVDKLSALPNLEVLRVEGTRVH